MAEPLVSKQTITVKLRMRDKHADCGAEHDRDVNAAINIARVGLDTLAEGALA